MQCIVDPFTKVKKASSWRGLRGKKMINPSLTCKKEPARGPITLKLVAKSQRKNI
jgi:hypothetical protein